ncbi:UNVERIFIED_ORG: hypothetical protein J2W85_004831 [Ensifer adhaerens]|nr:hypothetical protein [Ensifer adhaerens]
MHDGAVKAILDEDEPITVDAEKDTGVAQSNARLSIGGKKCLPSSPCRAGLRYGFNAVDRLAIYRAADIRSLLDDLD